MWVKNKNVWSSAIHNADVARESHSARFGIRGGKFFKEFLEKFFFVSMILPQVHLRKPCYDFSFLEMFRFKRLRASRSARITRFTGALREFHRNIHR